LGKKTDDVVRFSASHWPQLSDDEVKKYVKWEANWDKRLAEVKAFVVRYRRYPRQGRTPAETSMYWWLYNNLPGKQSHTAARWEKLNDAFEEGWEADFGEEGHKSQREAKWDKLLVQVKAWVVRRRRYPRQNKTPAETSMNNWLRRNLPGKKSHTPARWKKLNDAFGKGWEAALKKGSSPRHRVAKWDARLVQVKAWVVRRRRYPGGSNTSAEASMYNWLRENLPGKKCHTPARWKKLNDTFGEDWCHTAFPVWSSSYFNRREADSNERELASTEQRPQRSRSLTRKAQEMNELMFRNLGLDVDAIFGSSDDDDESGQ
jgi:hypothetical protein